LRAPILYEVVATLAPDIREDYMRWLEPHIKQMLSFDGFLSGEAFVNSENPCEVTSLYRLRDMDAMKAYLDGPAAAMRADGAKRFGDKLSAQRRILNLC